MRPEEMEDLEEMGPVDYLVLEWPGRPAGGDVASLVVDLVERGIVRVLDIALVAKGDDGSVTTMELGDDEDALGALQGAASGLIGQEDVEEAAKALEPGTTAAILVWENRWAARVAVALRRSGGQMVASGRIPIQAILASLEAVEGVG